MWETGPAGVIPNMNTSQRSPVYPDCFLFLKFQHRMRWQDTCSTFENESCRFLWPCQPLHTFDFLFFFLKEREKPRRNPTKNGCDPLPRFPKWHLSSFSSLIALAPNYGIFSSRFFCHCLPIPVKEAEGALALIKEQFACSCSQPELMEVYCTLLDDMYSTLLWISYVILSCIHVPEE